MIVLFTDFGADDIYVDQMRAALVRDAPAGTAIVDLLHSVPNFDARAAAHLLAALACQFPAETIFLAVIDPGVGGARDAVILEADGKWYVGPDNGLLSVVAARAKQIRIWCIVWRPQALSASFHGRDLFAPVAASIAAGQLPVDKIEATGKLDVHFGPDDLPQVIYVDHYGNALTGLRASNVPREATIEAAGHRLRYARVFADAPDGSAFWYENSSGLVEIALSRDSAAAQLGLKIGDVLKVIAS